MARSLVAMVPKWSNRKPRGKRRKFMEKEATVKTRENCSSCQLQSERERERERERWGDVGERELFILSPVYYILRQRKRKMEGWDWREGEKERWMERPERTVHPVYWCLRERGGMGERENCSYCLLVSQRERRDGGESFL